MPIAAAVAIIAEVTGVTAAIGEAIVAAVGIEGVSAAAVTAIGSATVSAGITAIEGGSVEDILKGAIVGGVASYVGGQVAKSVGSSVAQSATNAGMETIASSMGRVVGSMAGGATAGAISGIAYGRDPLESALKAGLTAGISSTAMEAVNYATSKIDGFSDLSPPAQRAIKTALASTIVGQDPKAAATLATLQYAGTVISDNIKDKLASNDPSLTTSYNRAKTASDKLDSYFAQQDKLVTDINSSVTDINQQQADLKAKVDAYNANPSAQTPEQTAALNDEVNAFNARQKQVVDTITANKITLSDVQKNIPVAQKEYTDANADLKVQSDTFTANEQKNADLIKAEAEKVTGIQSAYKNSTGEELTADQINNLYAQKSPDIKEAAAKDLGYASVAEMDAAIASGKSSTILGPTTYKDAETAYADANKKYTDASVLAAIQKTPEAQVAAQEAKLNLELAQKNFVDFGGTLTADMAPAITPELVQQQQAAADAAKAQANPAVTTTTPTTTPSNNTKVTDKIAETIASALVGTAANAAGVGGTTTTGGLASTGATNGTTTGTTGALQTKTSPVFSASNVNSSFGYKEAPNIMMTPQQIAERENFILKTQLKRGGLASIRKI